MSPEEFETEKAALIQRIESLQLDSTIPEKLSNLSYYLQILGMRTNGKINYEVKEKKG